MLHLSTTSSTNTYLRRAAAEANGTLAPFTAVRADFQTAGRGQVGNSWESESGKNLLMSVYLLPHCLDVHQQFYLSMAVSLAVVDALRCFAEGEKIDFKIKWPNDIYVGDKKLGGILIENNLRGAQIADTIVGLGINVNQTTFVSDAPNPISLRQITGKEHSVGALAHQLVEKLVQRMAAVEAQMWQTIADEYFTILLRTNGGFYSFSDQSGVFSAQIKRILPTGHLVLACADGSERTYAFKEVEHIF